MGINLCAGLEYLLMEHDGLGYKKYENKSILMLGKQDVQLTYFEFFTVCQRIKFNLKDFDNLIDEKVPTDIIKSDELFCWMGFDKVKALDISDYEEAEIVFDLSNREIPSDLQNTYDYIYDGGTLEHIFDFPTALINTSKILKKGGTIIHDVPANNWMNHGFYSFSPTVFADYYDANNWTLNSLYLVSNDDDGKCLFRTPDCRFINCTEFTQNVNTKLLLICIATKEENSTIGTFPIQSLYKDLQADIQRNQQYGKFNLDKKINKLISKVQNKKIAIYGIGPTAEQIIKAINGLKPCNIQLAGLYDSHIDKIGTWIEIENRYISVLDIHKCIEDDVQAVIIGSASHNAEKIYKRIKWIEEKGIQVIKLDNV